MVNKYKRRDFLKLSRLATVSVLRSAHKVSSNKGVISNASVAKKFPFISIAAQHKISIFHPPT